MPAADPGVLAGAPGSASGLEALRQIQVSARALLDQGQVEATWAYLLSALEAVLVQNRDLTLLVAKLRRAYRGTRSERVDPGQLALLFEALIAEGTAAIAVDPEADAHEEAALDREIAQAEQARAATAQRRAGRRRGAGWCAPEVRRQVHQVDVPKSERRCQHCGGALSRLGTDVTRRLHYVPGHFEAHEYHRATYACGRCKEGVTPPAPPQVLPRSAADASVLAQVVVGKFADHVPLHRQHRIYARSGADIPVSTLADWTAGVGDLVEPLVERPRRAGVRGVPGAHGRNRAQGARSDQPSAGATRIDVGGDR